LIELQMVGRIIKRGLLVAPVLVAVLWIFGGMDYAVSGAIGLGMTLLNLWLSARIIGGVAEKNPKLLLAAGMVAFTLGLAVLTAIAFALQALDLVIFEVTGITLIVSHLVLVLWEAARAYPAKQVTTDDAVRS
jgi:hypothetical protein